MNFQSTADGNWQAPDPGPEARRLAPALAASLCLHVLLLWPAALPQVPPALAQPLVATLRAAVSPPAPVPAEAVARHRPPPAAAPQRHSRKIDTDKPAPFATASLAPAPAAEHWAEARAPGPSAAGQSAAPPASPPVAAVVALEAAADGVDADGIRSYRIGLARGARAHKRYPLLARERGWAGTAEVRVDVSRDGRPLQVLLARSSGHDLLDREAVDMLERAAAGTAVPESLRGRAFAVSLPVLFDLSETR